MTPRSPKELHLDLVKFIIICFLNNTPIQHEHTDQLLFPNYFWTYLKDTVAVLQIASFWFSAEMNTLSALSYT